MRRIICSSQELFLSIRNAARRSHVNDVPRSQFAVAVNHRWNLNFRVTDDSPRQRTRRSLSVRGAIGLDVLVESQHVAWVVLFLDLHEASIVRPITRADQLVTRIAQLVYVHSMRKGL